MKYPRPLMLLSVAIVAILVGAVLSQAFRTALNPPPQLKTGTLLPEAREIPAFTLTDARQQPLTKRELQGHWSLLFFGYTTCPDVCPTTLSTLVQVDKALADLPPSQRPQVVFVTVDPQRDTAEKMAAYLKFFNPNFVGVTGSQPQIDALTRSLGVPVAFHPWDGGGYTIDHSATLFALDTKARMTAVFSPPYEVKPLADDLRQLVQY